MPIATKTTPTTVSCLNYRDADAAVSWLCKAFGFEEHAIYRDSDGGVIHAELTIGNGMIMLGPENKGEFGRKVMTLPGKTGGRCTQAVYVIVEDVDAHHDRALAAGARIVTPLKDEPYGGRDYSALDPEGHAWSFGTYDPWSLAKGKGGAELA